MEPSLAELLALSRLTAADRNRVRKLASFAKSRALLAPYLDSLPERYLDHLQRWIEESGRAGPTRCVVHWFSSTYPERLRNIHNPPLVLFVAGNIDYLAAPQIALVGSRAASHEGLIEAAYFAEQLTRAGLLVSSGLAKGVDHYAHKGALKAGPTLAVLATGPDIAAPTQHRQLQQQIEQSGLLVSEFAPGMSAQRDHFSRRNRILSGLALGVLIIEAKLQSGSLVTARLALEHDRSLLVLPGSIWNPHRTGNLQLLQQGAALVVKVDDVFNELNLKRLTPYSDDGSASAGENNCDRSLANPQLLANVGYEATSIDTIVARSGLPVAVVSEQLVLLELEGRVASVAGGYIRMGRR
ncbi:DNA-processing protein DprA [Pseudidiomarina sp. CB1]|uniref:DNA-processing protein DprA n=1 Tax=Pseudidiomarina sp. CB1 TaxID=2972484 RepID=UPI002162E078|nr:DNA-processing protein DprA [Pseudidiomarina sp. CB1]